MEPRAARLVFALVGDVRGSTRALRQLRWLAEEGVRADVLTVAPPGPPLPGLPDAHLHVLPPPRGRGPRFFWAAHRAVRRAALALPPAGAYLASDLYTLPALAEAARRHRAGLLYDARELYAHLDSSAGRPWVAWTWSAVERRFLPRCDGAFTVNATIARRLAEAYGVPEPTLVHNLPVAPAPPRTDALRARLGLPADLGLVLYQGLFRHGRGLETLVDAVARLPRAALVLVGDGPLREALVRRAEPLGRRAHVLPFTPPADLLPLTASADVGACVLEPISESVRLALPNKLFEYLGAGLPVVVTDLPELRAVVEGFDVGLVVPPGDPEALAAALHRALTDEAARARWAAHRPSVFAHFDPARDRARFLGVVRAVLAAHA